MRGAGRADHRVMAKWGLFGAHRYLEEDPGSGRTHRADGRPLVRPWRVTRPDIAARVRRERYARRQPAWPRLLGVACVLAAGLFAAVPSESIHPVPRHVAAPSSARTGAVPSSLVPLSPAGRVARAPERFEWRALPGTTTAVVVLDASYSPLAEVRGVAAETLVISEALRGQLEAAGTFHWYVEARLGERLVRSPLETCEIR